MRHPSPSARRGQGTGRPVEDLLARDRPMAVAELAWLALFALGLSS